VLHERIFEKVDGIHVYKDREDAQIVLSNSVHRYDNVVMGEDLMDLTPTPVFGQFRRRQKLVFLSVDAIADVQVAGNVACEIDRQRAGRGWARWVRMRLRSHGKTVVTSHLICMKCDE
jgi:hypothetical protein